jgi:hypothetical protein
MKQKITLYVLLLLVCRPVAAEPIHKPDNTTAAHPSISPKNVTGPANRLFGAATTPAPMLLTNWFAKLKRAVVAGTMQPSGAPNKPRRSPTMTKLPQECSAVLTAGGFEPQPVNAKTVPPPILRALVSKESGPPPPELDAGAVAALIASTHFGIPLPDRNPNR